MKRGKKIGNRLFVFEKIESDVAEVNSTIPHSVSYQQTSSDNDDSTSNSNSDYVDIERGITELNIAVLDRDNFVELTKEDPTLSPRALKAQQIIKWNNEVISPEI